MYRTKILTRFTHNYVFNKNAHNKVDPEMLCAILFSEKQREKHQNFQKSENTICKRRVSNGEKTDSNN